MPVVREAGAIANAVAIAAFLLTMAGTALTAQNVRQSGLKTGTR
jgi:hypothetical protein